MNTKEDYITNHTFCECVACKSTNHVIETRVGNLVNDVRVADIKNEEVRASDATNTDEYTTSSTTNTDEYTTSSTTNTDEYTTSSTTNTDEYTTSSTTEESR